MRRYRKPRSVKHRRTGRPIAESRLIAFHEAGHCIASLASKLPVAGAALDGDDGDGYMAHAGKGLDWLESWVGAYVASLDVPGSLVTLRPPKLSARQREQIDGYVVTCWGGIVAESILLEGRAGQRWGAKLYSDRLDAEGAARMLGLGPKRARAYVMARREKARRILIERWHQVKAAAQALRRVERCPAWMWRELEGAELRRIVRAVDASRKTRP
jgi:hypothetical protein